MRARTVLSAGNWDASEAVDTVRLDCHDRQRRRRVMTTDGGRDVLLDLPRPMQMREGDGLLLDDGGVVRIVALPEKLLEIHAHDDGELARIAWHLGNRHLPVQFVGERLRIRDDHVIAEMVAILGGHVAHVEAAFDPESGAYAGGHPHHDHAHDG